MKQGTTYKLIVSIDKVTDIDTVDSVIFTFADFSKTKILQKTYPADVKYIEKKFNIFLTQEDTVSLAGKGYIEAQINFKNKSVAKTEISRYSSKDTLATEFVEGNTPNDLELNSINLDIEGELIYARDGVTFIPNVNENGEISWSNNGDLKNPEPRNIKGPQGKRGEKGEKGDKGDTGADGYSPSASVVRGEGKATITITDKKGTTSADVFDGQENAIETVKVNGEALPIQDKAVNIDLSDYAKSADVNKTYVGQDLTVKFADEIKGYSDEWAWMKARKNNGDYKGLHVGDYIPITCSNGYVLNAQIAGINTYTGYGYPQVENHIDFICKELWNDPHVMNKVNYNNGNANSLSPFLASDLNYWLNSMSGNVPNSTSDAAVTTEVDYTTDGVLYYLPDKLKNQIVPKRILLPRRYVEGKVIINDSSWAWQSTGKLWIPSEVEVYGAPCWGNSGFGAGGFVQYPIFIGNMNRAKKRCSNKDRCGWWLLSASAGSSTIFACVSLDGLANNDLATVTYAAVPVCFRI